MSDPSHPTPPRGQDTQVAPRPAGAATDVVFTAEGLLTRLGRYEIVESLGEGGMAEVFLARHMGPGGFEKKVVIKRIRPELSDDDKFVRMFFREARNSARLSHPNVVSIFELAEDDDQYFLVMEYLEGLSWRNTAARRWYARRPLPIPTVLKAISDAAFGLAHAHALTDDEGHVTPLIHRDVSPDNLFLTLSGVTKVLDFGIAKQDTETNHGDLTQTGEIKGKVPYMSPEQLMGEHLDGRSDIWSLGVTLYWMLTGQRPFKGRRQLQLIDQILTTTAPDPREDNPDIPSAVVRVVRRALQRDLDQRFATATEMGDALLDIIEDRDVQYASQALVRDAMTLQQAPSFRHVRAALKSSPAAEPVDTTALHAVPYHPEEETQERAVVVAPPPHRAPPEETPAARPDALTAQMPMLPPGALARTDDLPSAPSDERDGAAARTETVVAAPASLPTPDTTAAGAPVSDEPHTAMVPARLASDFSDDSETADAARFDSLNPSIAAAPDVAAAETIDNDATRGPPRRNSLSDTRRRRAPTDAASPDDGATPDGPKPVPGAAAPTRKPAPRMPAVPDLFASSGLTDSGVRPMSERTAQRSAQPVGEMLMRIGDEAASDPDALTRALLSDAPAAPSRPVTVLAPRPPAKSPSTPDDAATPTRRNMSLLIAGVAALPVLGLLVFFVGPMLAPSAGSGMVAVALVDGGAGSGGASRRAPAIDAGTPRARPVAAPDVKPEAQRDEKPNVKPLPKVVAPPTAPEKTPPPKVTPQAPPKKPAAPPVPVRLRVSPTRGVLWGADGRVLPVKSGRVRVLSNVTHLTAYREATGSYHEVPVRDGAARLDRLAVRRVRFVTDKPGATVRYHKTRGTVGTLPFAPKPFTIGRYAFILTFKDGGRSETGQVEIVGGEGVQVITALSAP